MLYSINGVVHVLSTPHCMMLNHGIAIAFQQENLMSNNPFPKDCLGMYPLAFLMGICNARVFLHNLKLLCSAQLAI